MSADVPASPAPTGVRVPVPPGRPLPAAGVAGRGTVPTHSLPSVGVGSRAERAVTPGSGDGLFRATFRPSRPARALVERRAGRFLRLMRESDRYRSLGFVRLGDYVQERLGISLRTAQEMMRVERALESLPLLEGAFEAGEISSGHVRVLSRVASAENEAFWVGLARRMGVKALARAVAGHGVEGRGTGAAGGEAAGECPGAFGVSPGQGPAAEAGPGDDGSGAEEPERERLEIVAPAWVAGFWRETVGFVRRLVGSHLPPGACLEMVLAEVAEGVAAPEEDQEEEPSAPDGVSE